MTASASIAVGSLVWVEDSEEAWIDGEVVEINGEAIKVICTSGKTAVATAAKIYPKDPEALPGGVDDMTKLAYLHEPGVLQNLRCRYDVNEIYTYTGNILIAVNPFQRLSHLYNNDIMEKYKGMSLGELSPHPFAIADAAYRQMIKEGISQSILVSGESGAGKTESTKMLMGYLAYMGGSSQAEGRTVEQQVLESSPVLEAFGNAKTVRNNNSSRFGKFVEIQFNGRGKISGAAIRTYLLERSRVCQVSDPERNYHCFYMLCAAPAEDLKKYKLGNPRTFHYLNQSNCYELDGVDDSKEYLSTRRAMDIVGISSDEQDAIFRVVAAILHLGNIEFAKVSDGDASQPKDDQSRFHLKTSAELLMCDEKCLEDSLCKRVMVTRDETITRSLNPDDAALSRDALAKIVYSRLFDWLVSKINNSIGQDPASKLLIGVLDIYGFESFKTNSFEQFCINLTNEKLQQHFNQHVFKMEQEEYTKEEINWSYIDFIDNQDILDLIEKKPGGIIALLDEACMFPRSTHETFAEKLYQTFRDHKRFAKPKLSRTGFTICHYAGDVTYQTELFLDKNKDYVVAEHQALLRASNCSFISCLFPPLPEESSKSSKFSSIGSRFKQQLQSLLETLSATEPHYIRCVKPNNQLKPAIFENANVLLQLRCGGVMEAIRISCAGYPTRKTFNEFINRFKILEPNVLNDSCDEITSCTRLLEKAGLKGYQIGKTKVFLRAGQMAELDCCRNQVVGRSACIVQRKFRSYLARKNFLSLRMAAVQIQAFCRGQVARLIYEHRRRTAAASTIQKDARMFISRKAYVLFRSSAVLIQAGIRGMAARSELLFRKRNKAAIAIQRHCRGHLARCSYLSLKEAAIAIQCSWRAGMACRELRKLKMAAKETDALREAKTKLEKQVEELTSQLQLETDAFQEAKTKLEKQVEELTSQLQLETDAFQEAKTKLEKQVEELTSQLQLETDAFQEAKTKLETQVEELTSQLQLEKRMRVDNEEAKHQETAKLQSALEEMQMQLQEAKELLMKEREASKKVAEQVPPVEEVPAMDHETAKLQSALEEMQMQLQETREMLMKEREAAKKVAEQVPPVEEVPVMDHETAKLQSTLEEMQMQPQETKDLPFKEGEAATKVAGQVPPAEEVPVIDHDILNKLTAENEKLKILVSSLEKKIDETEKKYEETRKLSDERLQQALDAESKIIQLKTEMQRLEEKISDMETADQILRHQALLNNPSGKRSGNFVQTTEAVDSGNQEQQSASPAAKGFGESDSMLRRSNIERQRENVDTLIRCITKDLGFSERKPIAAFTIYKCLIHWRSFEAERTNVFDRLIQIIGSAIEDESDNDSMAYWLSNTSTLLFLLQRTLKPTCSSPSTSFFGRMAQGFRSSSANLSVVGLEGLRQVEAKYPALLFKEQLTAYVEKIYGIIRDNSKKELTPLLSSCIQASKTSPGTSLQSSDQSSNTSSPTADWQSIIDSLNGLLNTMKDNFVPLVLVQKIFTQIFSYINVQLFNSLLLHRECCTFNSGEYVKAGLAEIERWCENAQEYAGSSWDELKYVQQTVQLLVIQQKSQITYDSLTTELCPILSSQQLYRICTLYWDENSSTESISPDVISSMKILTTEDADDADGNSFLLDDNSGIPFSVDDISSSLQDLDFKGVKPAEELLENPAFEFLQLSSSN